MKELQPAACCPRALKVAGGYLLFILFLNKSFFCDAKLVPADHSEKMELDSCFPVL